MIWSIVNYRRTEADFDELKRLLETSWFQTANQSCETMTISVHGDDPVRCQSRRHVDQQRAGSLSCLNVGLGKTKNKVY